MFEIAPQLLQELHKPVPRYTSYPTAVDWVELSEHSYLEKLQQVENNTPLSLYIHIPFCEKMCLYCGCSVILNRKAENEERYVETLLQEIELVAQRLPGKKRVVQLHFGGGTPTKLSAPLLRKIMEKLHSSFDIDFCKEVAMEVDPRTVYEDQGAKLHLLKELGFNRVSFGVQDTQEKVQEAVKRRQSWAMTKETFLLAKRLGFEKINIDLIYGLPYQTEESFSKTTAHILELKPDRIALFSYAKVPWLKAHQKAIKEETLPSTQEKFAIYAAARNGFIKGGYQAIGMDHFALAHDELALAYRTKSLQRNFQGYSVTEAVEMISFGVSAISFVGNGYFQNHKELSLYTEMVTQKKFPIHKGYLLHAEDIRRKEIIHTLMCQFELPKNKITQAYLDEAREEIAELIKKELLYEEESKLVVTPTGELFIRNIATLFDQYRKPYEQKFSKSI